MLRLKWKPGLQFFRGRRVNVQRPRPPHYERALALAVLQPQYDWDLNKTRSLPNAETCRKVEEIERYKKRPVSWFARLGDVPIIIQLEDTGIYIVHLVLILYCTVFGNLFQDNPLEKIIAKELKELFDSKKFVAFLHANTMSGEELFEVSIQCAHIVKYVAKCDLMLQYSYLLDRES